jgi:predicted nucleic acid-binding protein
MAAIVVDTSVWVNFFRLPGSPEGEELAELLENGQAAMVAVVLAELMRGARDEAELEFLEETLGALPFLEAQQQTWKRAGRLLFQMRRSGVNLHLADALIATVAQENGCPVYSLDEDFGRIPNLQIHRVASDRGAPDGA